MIVEHKGNPRVIKLLNSATAEELNQFGFDLDHNKPHLKQKTKNNRKCFFLEKTRSSKIKFGLLDGSGSKDKKLVAVKKCLSHYDNPTETKYRRLFYKTIINEFTKQQQAGTTAPKLYGFSLELNREGVPKAYIAMELIPDGNLSHQLESGLFLPLPQKIVLARMVAVAVQDLHNKKIYHGDLKSLNILIDQQGDKKVKIIDYGHAHSMQKFQKNEPLFNFSANTISLYHAPEIYEICKCSEQCKPFMGTVLLDKADIYSLGIIFCQLFGQFDKGRSFLLWYNKYYEYFPDSVHVNSGNPVSASSEVEFTTKMEQLGLPDNASTNNGNRIYFTNVIDEKITQSSIPHNELENLVSQMLKYTPEDRPDLDHVIKKLESIREYLPSDPEKPMAKEPAV